MNSFMKYAKLIELQQGGRRMNDAAARATHRISTTAARHCRLGEDAAPPRIGLWQAIEDNHRYNCLLWDEEDLARRRNVPDAEIAGNKRAIDGYNQKRNDAIERIDEQLAAISFRNADPVRTRG